MSKVLITGAHGLIGSRLQVLLKQKGYAIHMLDRESGKNSKHQQGHFTWNVEAGSIDTKCFEGVDAIIHLAGAGVAEKRWTAARKKEIMDSRIDSTRLLFEALKTTTHQVKTIVSASAVGYYGDCGNEVLTENHSHGDSFLAEVVTRWEREVGRFEALNIRHVCCRIGVVLSAKGGALPELDKTIPFGIAGYFAKPDLYYSWIHIDDVCGIMIHGVANEAIKGSYNTTGPNPVPIKELIQEIVTARKSKAVLVPIPPFVLKTAMGEMSEMILQSQRCSDQKILDTGYAFKFSDLRSALRDIYK